MEPKKRKNTNDSKRTTKRKAAQKPNPQYDEDNGHLIIKPKTLLNNRYVLIGIIGQGTFGKVCEAYDKLSKTFCAIKIIKSIQKYSDAAQLEIRILNYLKECDPIGQNQCIQLLDSFCYHDHVCMVFELLKESLFDYFEKNEFNPFSIRQIQSFARQLINSVLFMHKHGLIHTDLKPENLMLKSNDVTFYKPKGLKERQLLRDTTIFLIDFGSALWSNDHHNALVSTRHYRAPEIVLGLDWSYPCDMWSIGCILIELYVGRPIFQTHEDGEHLKMMEIILGEFPSNITQIPSDKICQHFQNGRVRYPLPDTEPSSIEFLQTLESVQNLISPRNRFEELFLDLVIGLLTFDPLKRLTAMEAHRHPFLSF